MRAWTNKFLDYFGPLVNSAPGYNLPANFLFYNSVLIAVRSTRVRDAYLFVFG